MSTIATISKSLRYTTHCTRLAQYGQQTLVCATRCQSSASSSNSLPQGLSSRLKSESRTANGLICTDRSKKTLRTSTLLATFLQARNLHSSTIILRHHDKDSKDIVSAAQETLAEKRSVENEATTTNSEKEVQNPKDSESQPISDQVMSKLSEWSNYVTASGKEGLSAGAEYVESAAQTAAKKAKEYAGVAKEKSIDGYEVAAVYAEFIKNKGKDAILTSSEFAAQKGLESYQVASEYTAYLKQKSEEGLKVASEYAATKASEGYEALKEYAEETKKVTSQGYQLVSEYAANKGSEGYEALKKYVEQTKDTSTEAYQLAAEYVDYAKKRALETGESAYLSASEYAEYVTKSSSQLASDYAGYLKKEGSAAIGE
uniref:Uncharacterized protein n=1 Tax=Plectus sambesii TaxID=2011161 RepID=A0A914X5F4_9BILA